MMTRRVLRHAAALAVCGLLTIGLANNANAEDKTLYQRLGGYDAIAASVDDFFARLGGDKLNGRFLATLALDRKKTARQLTVDYICEKAGGPCIYLGRDMKESHAGMGITQADWDASVVHLNATLDKFKVEGETRADFVKLVTSIEDDIVDKK